MLFAVGAGFKTLHWLLVVFFFVVLFVVVVVVVLIVLIFVALAVLVLNSANYLIAFNDIVVLIHAIQNLHLGEYLEYFISVVVNAGEGAGQQVDFPQILQVLEGLKRVDVFELIAAERDLLQLVINSDVL